MSYIFVGLGNPGEEYEGTRHNAGRMALESFRKIHDFPEWEFDKKLNALVSQGKIKKVLVALIFPQTFMNKSGLAVKPLVKNVKQAERLVVLYDDLDLPIGKLKISYHRSSGGHRGLESIIKNLKTEKFIRIRIGISPANAKGAAKKPAGEQKILDFIIGKFKLAEFALFKKEFKKISEILETIVLEGKDKAMSFYN